MQRGGRWLLGLLLVALPAGALLLWLGNSGRNSVGPDAHGAGSPLHGEVGKERGNATQPGLVGAGRGENAGSSAASGVRLEGRTIDDADGTPIEGVRVRATRVGDDGEGGGGAEARVAHSDAEGRFAINDLEPGKWHVTTWHPMFVPFGLEALLSLGADDPLPESVLLEIADPNLEAGAVQETTLRLRAGVALTGRVIDPAGAPVAGATIRLAYHDAFEGLLGRLGTSWAEWRDLTAVSSDAVARFRLGCLPPVVGKVRLGAFYEGFVCRWSEPIDVAETARHPEVELQLVSAASVRGTVRHEDGTPAVGVLVAGVGGWPWYYGWAFERPEAVATDATGFYELRGLPPSRVELEARWRNPDQDGATVNVQGLRPAEVREAVDLVVPGRIVLRVRIVDEKGSPVAGEVLRIEHAALPTSHPVEGGLAQLTARTDASGRATFLCDSRGPYRVVQITTWPVSYLAESALPSHEEITLLCTPTPQSIKSAQEGKIAGWVRTSAGIDVGATPLLYFAEVDSPFLGFNSGGWRAVDATGYFEETAAFAECDVRVGLDEKAAGLLGLYAPHPHVLARAGASGIEFELLRGESIRGRVLGAQVDGLNIELRARHLTEGNWRTGTLEDDGSFAVPGLPPGSWQLEFAAETPLGYHLVLAVRVAEAGA